MKPSPEYMVLRGCQWTNGFFGTMKPDNEQYFDRPELMSVDKRLFRHDETPAQFWAGVCLSDFGNRGRKAIFVFLG